MKKAIDILITSLSIFIFIFSIYVIIGSSLAVRNNELFRIFGYSYALVPTNSMEGTNEDSFSKGSIVIINHTPYEDLEIGDVVVYKSNEGILIIHRIIEETEEGFIVKGDNNSSADNELVTLSNYQGKHIRHFQFMNIGLWLIDARAMLLLILGIILLISVLYQMAKIVIEYKRAKLEKFKKSLEEESHEE
ncbi:signal peptidase I [Acholeplasma hippikon]|uniref:Signal peptidase I n=1 Tax=Acholeplasma hippikon TaxID=264636 RepID=A0A449BLL1_9MOLU|nr:signal peptidase I [Acholeplasma hippikon]VEU83330.1 Signal peptidase I W [Acholeplasma hippikon]